jgi:hypothetical protein
MGQFKPMVKMETTEPSIELKLKKGGKVEKKMQMGGMPDMAPPAMPARGGMMPGRAPMPPSLAARRRAMRGMPAAAAPAGPVGMAGQMMKEGGESKAEHQAEMAKMGKTAKALKEHAAKPASKAHKGLKTGGVVMGQGGYKKGGRVKMAEGGVPKSGIINTEGQGGEYRNTKMDTAKPDHSPAKTGDVKMGNAGGYATGGVAKANAGGYKKGGSAKKAFATGGVVNSGAPVAMPQGRKKPSAPVSITELSGTFKKGGKVTAAEGRLQKNFAQENATAMKEAKAYSNEVYSKYGKKMASGGVPSAVRDQQQTEANQQAYRNWERSEQAENEAMRNAVLAFPRKVVSGIKGLFSPKAPDGSVTKTKESVTVTPGKKRGGAVAC